MVVSMTSKSPYYPQIERPTGYSDFGRHCMLPAKRCMLDEAARFQTHEKGPGISYVRTKVLYSYSKSPVIRRCFSLASSHRRRLLFVSIIVANVRRVVKHQ
ncbi:Piso0_002071 [Millerozyma farinosa CBS 7064]|uniref:Piso0_002071 protein n=1 Tax=Pichia sorbitophila (strain ATCC MYA-4447 / BCRC 22081 / CBS 7064 / NBRC 10061 / NRRL Y-12695) TaxID=559304 RepID=G8YE16_PICSO|nr:Piso0_002071 [Millerozyma farinosa CBS 7064]